MTSAFGFWFSYIVLQRYTAPIIALLVNRLFAQLAPGGVAIFQLATYVPGYKIGNRLRRRRCDAYRFD